MRDLGCRRRRTCPCCNVLPAVPLAVYALLLAGCLSVRTGKAPHPGPLAIDFADWRTQTDGRSQLAALPLPRAGGAGIALRHKIGKDGGYVQVCAAVTSFPSAAVPLVLHLRAQSAASLEIKLEDRDGTVFGRKLPLAGKYEGWAEVVLYRNDFEYWWGGRDDKLSAPATLSFAVSGSGQGTVELAGFAFGAPGTPASLPPVGPQLDPDRNLPGLGVRARRAATMAPEDPLILAWLKIEQDISSPEKRLLRTGEGNLSHTFNNALVAMAFLVKGERERAERILDDYAARAERGCSVPNQQDFFFRGEPRGFFQAVVLRPENGIPAYHAPPGTDRWIGDMAWLLLAYLQYGKTYDAQRYAPIVVLLRDLLVSFYSPAPNGQGGFVQHGWRKGDVRLHEGSGHPEGNIDCYAALRLCEQQRLARSIRRWLNASCRGSRLPLDLYSWRALAFGPGSSRLLDIPESDLRYRKTLWVDGRPVVGFYDHPDGEVQNVWLDGLGHMACAYLTLGDRQRGYFYANQMDVFVFAKSIGGVPVHVLPYTANRQGGYQWVDPACGAVSAGAWYVFAKNGFNPLRLERVRVDVAAPDGAR